MRRDTIVECLSFSTLESKWKSNFEWQERNPCNNRMRRAASWLTRAEQEPNDPDAAFIFYWMKFNGPIKAFLKNEFVFQP